MKKRVIAGYLIFAGAIAALVVSSVRQEKEIEEETSAFVTDTISAISKDWNFETLVSRAEPGLIKAMTVQGESVTDLFDVYRTLGNLKDDPDCHLQNTSQLYDSIDTYTAANYHCDAEYDNGTAHMIITVRRGKISNEWKVYYININSPYFTRLRQTK